MTIIKICGLTQAEDVALAMSLGAQWLGFIHVKKSPRYVDIPQLRSLLDVARGAHRVVVVRNASEEELAHLRAELDFEAFQFHGDEPETYLQRFGGYRVFHIAAEDHITSVPKTFGSPFLLDTSLKGQQGGTGKTFDWEILPQVAGQFLVAGGLNPDNVGRLVSDYHPWGVDVSSGVESTPGKKDHQKLTSFIQRIKEVSSHE